MGQYFEVEDEFHDIRLYAFHDGAPRPDEAKPGDEIELDLVPMIGEPAFPDGRFSPEEVENGLVAKRLSLTARVTWRENYPNGYELICVAESLKRRATVVVNKGHPDMDGAKLQAL